MRWHLKNESTNWPKFEKFLKSHLLAALAKESIGKPFAITAIGAVPIFSKPRMPLAITSALRWPTDPPIWVDRLKTAAAIFSKTDKSIVVDDRIIKTFERSPARQDYTDALEMLMLHELMHYLIDSLNGTSEHDDRHDPKHRDPVYDFETAAYASPETLDRTLDRMLAAS